MQTFDLWPDWNFFIFFPPGCKVENNTILPNIYFAMKRQIYNGIFTAWSFHLTIHYMPCETFPRIYLQKISLKKPTRTIEWASNIMPKSFAATWVFNSAISRDLEAKIPFILCRQLVKVLSHVFFYILHFIGSFFLFRTSNAETIIHFDCSDLQMAFGCWQRIQGHQTRVHIIWVASIESLAIEINTPAYQLFGMV